MKHMVKGTKVRIKFSGEIGVIVARPGVDADGRVGDGRKWKLTPDRRGQKWVDYGIGRPVRFSRSELEVVS